MRVRNDSHSQSPVFMVDVTDEATTREPGDLTTIVDADGAENEVCSDGKGLGRLCSLSV